MTTIDQIARTIQTIHGIDTLEAARAVVTVHVDQVVNDPALYDAATGTLTEQGRDLVTMAVAESYASGQVATDAQDLLDQIAAEAAAIDDAERLVRERTERRDELIRAAMGTELRRADIAHAAGVKEARLYQIRDGRR